MFHEGRYLLQYLKLGLGLETGDIIDDMWVQHGTRISQTTAWRIATGKADVAGLPDYAIKQLFSTNSGVAILAQTAIWIVRRAVSEEWAGDERDLALGEAEELIQNAQARYDELIPPANDEARGDRALDLASIAEAKGQLAATYGKHYDAFLHFLEAYRTLLPIARRAGCAIGAVICLARTLGAALNEAYDCDEQSGRRVGKDPIDRDWCLWTVLQCYEAPSPIQLLVDAVERTGDDRIAANHADGLALAKKPLQAARMIQVGLSYATDGTTLDSWQPLGRTQPVISESYMADAVVEFKRLTAGKPSKAATGEKNVRGIIVAILIGAAALTGFTTMLHVPSADARPGRVTLADR